MKAGTRKRPRSPKRAQAALSALRFELARCREREQELEGLLAVSQAELLKTRSGYLSLHEQLEYARHRITQLEQRAAS